MAIGIKSYRPTVSGSTHMVTAGHYLATASGYRILEQGGNATDAGVAAGITLNVVLPQWTNFGGVAPIIIHDVWEIIGKLKEEGLSILLVEQNASLALKLVDYVHVLSKGQVVYSAEPQELWANEEVKSRYLGI